MLRVRDIMIRNVFTLHTAAPIEEAIWGLRTRGVGAAPVHDRRGRLVGIVSKSDLLEPQLSANEGPSTVGAVMTRNVICVGEHEPALVAVHRMVHAGVHRLLVVDDAHQVVGIVSSKDVLSALDRGEPLGNVSETWSPEWDFVESHSRSTRP